MHKEVLSEQAIYFSDVTMPKGFEIDRDKLTSDILQSVTKKLEMSFSKDYDMLNTYVKDHIEVEYSIKLINKEKFGTVYKPKQMSAPLLNVNPVDLKNSADYTMLYGVKTENCIVKIYYDDNRRKNKSYNFELKNNMFLLFPATNMYVISNEQKDSLNFIQTITYESF
jgi:hypothetical protein